MTRSGRPATSAWLLACGNVDRRDDGAALAATRGLDATACGQLDIDDLLAAPAGRPIVICDAAAGVEAGRVVTLRFDELLANPHGPAPHSSHALPIDQVIGVARAVAGRPIDGLFVGIGGVDFGFGEGLSAPVAAGLPAFRAAIERVA
jgi:hydrogenase maturation protease